MGGAFRFGFFVGFRFLRNADSDAIRAFDSLRVFNRGSGANMMRPRFLVRAFGGGGSVSTWRPAIVDRWSALCGLFVA